MHLKKFQKVIYKHSLLSDYDIYLFKQGSHFRLYNKLGSHLLTVNGENGTYFAVWAPNAEYVSVIGDFNNWNPEEHPLKIREDGSGIWEGFIPEIGAGALYKYYIVSKVNQYRVQKKDPFAFYNEVPPKTASCVWNLDYNWKDEEWLKNRGRFNGLDAPISIYEVHLGSWKRVPEEKNRFLSYVEIAHELVDYVKEMGFTHVEFLPVMEHPFYGSWGYETLGYFAPTSRYGTPWDFMYLIDYLHQNGIGVILDWVPSHFPNDEFGLAYFDGTHLFEHSDPRKGVHPHWNSLIFNYDRYEVRNFLISSALFWFDKYHIDGIRVDAVASMLYLDYGRKEGEWVPNEFGGRENIPAINFLKKLNEVIYENYPDTQTIAEESTAWQGVSRPTYTGGLGFGMKWNMGWMNDTLKYFSKDPIYRKYYHNQLTFSIWYAFSENFILPISHDEVVHQKGSIYEKMPGDKWQKFANIRLLYGYMFAHPGKKLLFMGQEFAQYREWAHEHSLDWHFLKEPYNEGVQKWIKCLNALYKSEPCLYELDFSPEGFEWLDLHNWEESILSFLRKDKKNNKILIVCNFTPVPRHRYRIGVPDAGFWKEILNSDAKEYGGSGVGNLGGVNAHKKPYQGKNYSLYLTLPPLGILFLKKI